MGAAGAAALGEALRTNTTLQTLDLGGNGLGAAGGIAAVEEALRTNAALRKQNLDSNNEVAAEGIKLSAAASADVLAAPAVGADTAVPVATPSPALRSAQAAAAPAGTDNCSLRDWLSIAVEAAGVAGAQYGDSLDLLAARMGALGVGDGTEFALRTAAERNVLLDRAAEAAVRMSARVHRLLLAVLMADEEADAPSIETQVSGMGAGALKSDSTRRFETKHNRLLRLKMGGRFSGFGDCVSLRGGFRLVFPKT